MSAMLAFLLITEALLDLVCVKYTHIPINIIKNWYIFNMGCLLAGFIEIANIRGKIKNYSTIYGLRFYQYILMMLSLAKTGIEFYTNNEVHAADLMCPIFILMLVFVLNAREYRMYQESSGDDRNNKIHS
jgi:hypothetical protein